MNFKPFISIIIPVYNAELYLSECLDSVTNQDYLDLELILVNDGSKDSSGQICDEFSKNYSYIRVIHTKNQGPGPARNTGLKSAAGDYICFVDADDRLSHNYFDTIVPFLKNDNPDILQFGFTRHAADWRRLNESLPPDFTINNFQSNRSKLVPILNSGCGYALWEKAIKSSTILENDIQFDQKKRGQDFTFLFRLYEKIGSIRCISKSLYEYRIVLGQSSKNDEAILENHIDNYKRVLRFFISEFEMNEVRIFLNRLYALWFLRVVLIHISGNSELSTREKKEILKSSEAWRVKIKIPFLSNHGMGIADKLVLHLQKKGYYRMQLIAGKTIRLFRRIRYR